MSNTELPDAWQLDSGLREDMVLSIHSAYFAPHAEYMEGKQLMLWLIGTDEAEDPVDVRLSVGADWETGDGGNTISHPTKRKQHINKNSIYGKWLAFCFEIPDLAKTLIERGQALGSGPTDARIWIDLILHLQNKTLTYGRNIPDQERLMPVEFMGLVMDTPVVQAAPAPAPVASAPATADPMALVRAAQAAAAQPAMTNGSPLYARAIQLAKSSPDFNTFVTNALADPEILADEELAIQCADQAILWTAAQST